MIKLTIAQLEYMISYYQGTTNKKELVLLGQAKAELNRRLSVYSKVG